MAYKFQILFPKFFFFFFLSIFFSSIVFSSQNDQIIEFSTPSTQTTMIEFSNSQVNYFSVEITPQEIDSIFPSNVSLDIGADGSLEWETSVGVSQTPLEVDEISTVTSTSNPLHLDFQSGMGVDMQGNSFGNLQESSFSKSTTQSSGILGITTIHNILSQRLVVSTPTNDYEVFLPEINDLLGTAGFYISTSGASYYCNSDHNFYLVQGCDLSVEEAMVEEHLAAGAPNNFEVAQKLSSDALLNAINQYLDSCSSFPCEIPFEFSSSTKGSLALTNFSSVYESPQTNIPAQITVEESSSSYEITITPGSPLKDVSYFYGVKPQVVIAPVLANDDSENYSHQEREFLQSIESNLVSRWDSMTENKFPLDFYLAQKPIVLSNYTSTENNYVSYINEAREELLSYVPDTSQPFIIVVVDIKDYFSQKNPQNSLMTYSKDSHAQISSIYINGFKEGGEFYAFDNYFTQILPNILLHELAHTFVQYSGNSDFFYESHPRSFTDSSILATDSITNAPTNQESYYEIYSILNQFRPYLKDSQVGGSPQLSSLDKLLMGIKNIYEPSNYRLYSTNIVQESSQLQISSISKITEVDAIPLYEANRNTPWWNIVLDSPRDSQGSLNSFSVSKSQQNSRALWVVANDAVFTNNYHVFSNNAESKMNVILALEESPEIEILSELGEMPFETTSFNLEISTQMESLCKFSNSSQKDFSSMEFEFESSNSLTHQYLFDNLSSGRSYNYYVVCESIDNGLKSSSTNIEFTILDSQDSSGEDSGSSNSGGSSGSSGTSGGSSGSSSGSSSDSDTDSSRGVLEDVSSTSASLPTQDITKCYSNFSYSQWSICGEGIQERVVVDTASCVETSIQTRSCEVNLSEKEIQKLNAKKYDLRKTAEKMYATKLVGSYNKLFYSESAPVEKEFLLLDESTGDQYLAEYLEENGSRTYYLLEKIYGNESLTSSVERETVIDSSSHPLFEKILTGISLLLVVGFVLVAIRFILKS